MGDVSKVRCTNCGVIYRIGHDKIGKIVRCSKCTKTFLAVVEPLSSNPVVRPKTKLDSGRAINPPISHQAAWEPAYSESDSKEVFAPIWNRLRESKLKSLKKRFQEELTERKAMLDYLRQDPLYGFEVCQHCGWLGPGMKQKQLASTLEVSAVTASIGGAIFGIGGATATFAGGALILSGLPMLCCFGIGALPIIIGVGFLIIGAISGTGGAMVGSMGAQMSSKAMNDRRQQQMQPASCPNCRAPAIVSAEFPVGRYLIESNPHIAEIANAERYRILQWVVQQEKELYSIQLPTEVDISTEKTVIFIVFAASLVLGLLIAIPIIGKMMGSL